MTTSASASASNSVNQQEHNFEFPLTDGEIDLDAVASEDLAKLAAIILALLSARRAEG